MALFPYSVTPKQQDWVDEVARQMVKDARVYPHQWLQLAMYRYKKMPVTLFSYAETLARSVLAGELAETELLDGR